MSSSSSPEPSPPARRPGGLTPYPTSRLHSEADHRSSPGDQVVFVIVAVLAGLVVAVVAAVAWAHLADPPRALVTKQGVFLTGEVDYDQQVSVTLWFLLIGGALGLVSGLVVGWRGRRHGVTAVLAVLLLCAAASGLSAWLGIHVFGPDLKAQAASASFGDLVTNDLSITSAVAYLGWPIGGLVGALVGIGLWPRHENLPQMLPASSTVLPYTPSARGQ